MSALDGWIDVCRTGTWRDAGNRERVVTEADLDRLVEGYSASDPAPVVVGHPEMDDPAYGWVESIRRTGDRLQAKLRDIVPEFRQAVEANMYAGRSIAADPGWTTLRHIGFLGARKPAVDGLAPTQFSAPPEQVVVLAGTELASGPAEAMRAAALTIARIARGMRERIIAQDGIEAADEALPSWEIEHLNRIADDMGDADQQTFSAAREPETKEGKVTDKPEGGEKKLDEAALAARAAELDARQARIDADEAKARKALALASAERAIEPHVTAGRVLPAEKAPLAALLASLPAGDDDTVAFAAPEGEGEVKKKPAEILETFLAALPERVDYGTELASGDLPPNATRQPADDKAIASEAQVLMSESASRGVTLTAAQAVDQVRAKRGLNGGQRNDQ